MPHIARVSVMVIACGQDWGWIYWSLVPWVWYTFILDVMTWVFLYRSKVLGLFIHGKRFYLNISFLSLLSCLHKKWRPSAIFLCSLLCSLPKCLCSVFLFRSRPGLIWNDWMGNSRHWGKLSENIHPSRQQVKRTEKDVYQP